MDLQEELDVKAYWSLFVRWWWLLMILASVGIAAGYGLSQTKAPSYLSTAKMLVRSGQNPALPTANDLASSQGLAQSLETLIMARPILEEVAAEIGWHGDLDRLGSKISVTARRNVLEVSARDGDPGAAALLANTTAQTFIDDFVEGELGLIAQLRVSLLQIGITDAEDASLTSTQVAVLSSLRIIEPALPARLPSSKGTRRNMVLGMLLGLALAALIIVAREYLDNTIKSAAQMKKLTGFSTLGTLMQSDSGERLGSSERLGGGRTAYGPSTIHEAYRFLQTNMDFAAIGAGGYRSALVTSAVPGEGKTTTAANLAVSMALDGKTVTLVDSDLWKPRIHHVFDVDPLVGFTNLLLGEREIGDVAKPTDIPGLSVICSGPLPPDSTTVLRSARARETVARLVSSTEVVIFDSPPLLVATDALMLSALVDCVLLIVAGGHTRADAVRHASEMLDQANPKIVGAVLNKMPKKAASNYGYYYYYTDSGDRNGSDRSKKRGRARRLLAKMIRR